MTGPVTTEALFDRKALRKAILAAIPENVPLRGRYTTAIMEQAIAPLLAALQQVTAERDEARKEASDLQNDWADEVAASGRETERAEAAEASLATATSELARLRAEVEAKDRALKDLRADAAELAGVLCYVSAYDDPKALRDLCWKAGHFLEERIVGIEPPALARAATAREGQADA